MNRIEQNSAIVIGAGIGGLAAAIRLQHAGKQVKVFESSAQAGGKLTEHKSGPFRFDRGPSLFTLPNLVDELFTLCGKNPRDYFNYKPLSVSGNYFFPDGTKFSAPANPEIFAEEWEKSFGESQENINSYFQKAKDIYEITNGVFLERSLHKLSTFFRWDTVKSIFRLGEIDSMQTMDNANSKRFEKAKSVQFFNRYATYNGSSPYLAPATLNVISHIEHDLGAFFPEGGMYRITEALFRLALEIGVEFEFNQTVDEIIVEDGVAKGVIVNQKKAFSGCVVSNMDIVPTYKKLLPNQKHPTKILEQPRSSSALIFYWGVNGNYPELDLHNLFFSEDYPAEFEALFNTKTIVDDPTIYLFVSSKEVPTDAPSDCENWFVMINAPHTNGQDWQKLVRETRKNLIRKLSAQLNIPDLEARILCEEVLTPEGIQTTTSSYLGALYGNASNDKFAAFLRHPNFSRKIKNLLFVGGSVHPGGGIPLCLLSAKIAVKEIK